MLMLQDESHGVLKMSFEFSELSPFCSITLQPFSFAVHQPKMLTLSWHSLLLLGAWKCKNEAESGKSENIPVILPK